MSFKSREDAKQSDCRLQFRGSPRLYSCCCRPPAIQFEGFPGEDYAICRFAMAYFRFLPLLVLVAVTIVTGVLDFEVYRYVHLALVLAALFLLALSLLPPAGDDESDRYNRARIASGYLQDNSAFLRIIQRNVLDIPVVGGKLDESRHAQTQLLLN